MNRFITSKSTGVLCSLVLLLEPLGCDIFFEIVFRVLLDRVWFGLAVLNRMYISPEIVLNTVYNFDKRPRKFHIFVSWILSGTMQGLIGQCPAKTDCCPAKQQTSWSF